MQRLLPDALHVGPLDTAGEIGRKGVRFHRWRSLNLLWKTSSLKSVRGCLRREAVSNSKGSGTATMAPYVELGTADGVGSIRGARRCANVHACPVCAPKVRNGRADEIMQVATRHRMLGGQLLFLTLTMPHRQGQRLAPLWSTVAGSWTRMMAGGTRQHLRDAYGLSGFVRTLEVTHGANGWHPHLHVLLLVDGPLSSWERDCMEDELYELWRAEVVADGWVAPTRANGVKLDQVKRAGDLGAYLTKMDGGRIDAELARADLKNGRRGGRSPWAILGGLAEMAANGDVCSERYEADLALWREYEQASYRKNAITFSHRLRQEYGVVKASDQELAEESVGHVTRAHLEHRSWRLVCSHGEATALLQAIEAGDVQLSYLVVDACGGWASDLRWLDPPPLP